jgi:DNA-directed RNA polymerase specialized sigma subunit
LKTINYRTAGGHTEKIEVTDEFAARYAEIEKEERRREWRDGKRKKREVSLEELAVSGRDIADPINRDPMELFMERDEPELPLFTGLTEYQRRVAVRFFVEHKSQAEIAKEEGVSRMSICRIINKAQEKIIGAFC